MPRGAAALGFAQYLPSENMLMTVQQMTDMMCMALGGRAAEQVMLGKISTGAPHTCFCSGFSEFLDLLHALMLSMLSSFGSRRCCVSSGLCSSAHWF